MITLYKNNTLVSTTTLYKIKEQFPLLSLRKDPTGQSWSDEFGNYDVRLVDDGIVPPATEGYVNVFSDITDINGTPSRTATSVKLPPKTAEEVLLLPYQFHTMLRILLIKDLITTAIEAFTDETTKIVAEEYLARSTEFYRTDPIFLILIDAVQVDLTELDTAWVNAEAL